MHLLRHHFRRSVVAFTSAALLSAIAMTPSALAAAAAAPKATKKPAKAPVAIAPTLTEPLRAGVRYRMAEVTPTALDISFVAPANETSWYDDTASAPGIYNDDIDLFSVFELPALRVAKDPFKAPTGTFAAHNTRVIAPLGNGNGVTVPAVLKLQIGPAFVRFAAVFDTICQ